MGDVFNFWGFISSGVNVIQVTVKDFFDFLFILLKYFNLLGAREKGVEKKLWGENLLKTLFYYYPTESFCHESFKLNFFALKFSPRQTQLKPTKRFNFFFFSTAFNIESMEMIYKFN